ncbi:CbrC family protein [Desertivirga arenae]|uniref:CbrC family protein n=1 Tax=Desertivirga arenae TaxID=2810309 RepID=UPI001A975DF4|nr:CbrC family protein [Pedobacter sp. SYSU D00823]
MMFKYFDRPEVFSGLKTEATTCDCCLQEKYCFDANFFSGTEDISSICPECLGSGKLLDKHIFSCSGDMTELIRQLKELHPSLTDSEIEKIAEEKTNELEKTTPYLVTWQEWDWPCADGDYCRFIGFGSRPLYNSLATTTSGEELFRNSFYYNLKDDSDIDYLWQDVLPDEEVKDYNDSNEMSTLFYVFKSLNSEKIVTIWDCE